jgi:hypothetical protein
VEDALAALMESYSERYDLSASELYELDRRIADPVPTFSDPKEIARLLGKRFGSLVSRRAELTTIVGQLSIQPIHGPANRPSPPIPHGPIGAN